MSPNKVLAMGIAVFGSSVGVSSRVNSYKAAFEVTQDGESLPAVIDRFGTPSIRETPSAESASRAQSSLDLAIGMTANNAPQPANRHSGWEHAL